MADGAAQELKDMKETVAETAYENQKLKTALAHFEKTNAALVKEHEDDTYSLRALVKDKNMLNEKITDQQERITMLSTVRRRRLIRCIALLHTYFAFSFGFGSCQSVSHCGASPLVCPPSSVHHSN